MGEYAFFVILIYMTEESLKEELLTSIYEELFRSTKKTGERKVAIFLGEVDDRDSQQKVKVLKDLKNEGIIKSFSLNRKSEEWGSEDVYVAYAKCILTISNKKLISFMEKLSIHPRYRISYIEEKGIILNDIVIANPHPYGTRFLFWEYILNNPNRFIPLSTLLKATDPKAEPHSFGLSVRKIVNDYYFSNSLKKLFFPTASTKGVYFRNPITQKNIEELKISEKQLKLNIRQMIATIKKRKLG